MEEFFSKLSKKISLGVISVMFFSQVNAKEVEVLSLDVISYDDFVQRKSEAVDLLKTALYEKGIVGIKNIPGYKDKVRAFIEKAREFSALSEDVKEAYAPNRLKGDTFLGYEKAKERFKRPDGTWVVDDLKASYYAFVPDKPLNKWPREVELKEVFQRLGITMCEVGKAVMEEIGLIGLNTDIGKEDVSGLGRMLYYSKSKNSIGNNPYWCGSHFDHGMFTALLPAFYFIDDQEVSEPIEAGLFVKTHKDGVFRKVISSDPEVLLFQVGEFGQLATNDAVRATEHRVHKTKDEIERYTLALFFDIPMDTVIHSTSELTKDERYGAMKGEACSYAYWSEASFRRYLVDKEEDNFTDIGS